MPERLCMVQGCDDRRAFASTVCWAHQGAVARMQALNAIRPTLRPPDG